MVCDWHLKNFGKEKDMGLKPPKADKRTTTGICDKCLDKWDRKVKKYKEAKHETKQEKSSRDM